MVKWLEQKGHDFKAGFSHLTAGKLAVNPAVNGYLLRIREVKAVKGEGWALVFINCAKDKVGL